MAWPLPDFINPNDDLDFYDTEPLMPPQSWTMMGIPQNEPPSQDTAEDYILQCTVCASLAEQAMARASNTKQPLACWGCGELTHLWSSCPQRSQPEARAKARKAMAEMFNNRSKFKQDSNTKPSPQPPTATYQPDNTPFSTRAAAIITN